MWEENLGTQAGVHLMEGVRLISGPLNTDFTVMTIHLRHMKTGNSYLLWFSIIEPSDWLKKTRSTPLFFTQSEVKQKPIVVRSNKFFRVLRRQHVFWKFHWFNGSPASFLISQSDHFGLNRLLQQLVT